MKEHSSKGLEVGLTAAIVAAPIFFGSVYAWAAMGLCSSIFTLLVFYPSIFPAIGRLPRISQVCWAALMFYLCLQTLFFSKSPYVSTQELLKWIAWGGAFLLVQQLPAQAVLRLLMTFVLVGFFESLYALSQLSVDHPMVLWQVKETYLPFATGTYINHNHFAGLLELCLGVHLGIFLYACENKRGKAAVLLGLMLLVSFAAFLKSGSRAGILSFGLSAALFIAVYFRARKKAMLFVGLFLLLAVLSWQAGFLVTRFSEKHFLDSFAGRWNLWTHCRTLLHDYPWGIGLGCFEWVYPHYQPDNSLQGWSHAHNDYIELLLSMGIPGFIFFAACFLVLAIRLCQGLRDLDAQEYALGWGCLLGLFSLTLHGLSDFNFAIPANTFLYFICGGLVFRMGTPGVEKRI